MSAARDLNGKRIVVLGLARQGIALSHFLMGQGAHVTVSDIKSAEHLTEAIQSLEGLPIQYALGGHPIELLDKCDLL